MLPKTRAGSSFTLEPLDIRTKYNPHRNKGKLASQSSTFKERKSIIKAMTIRADPRRKILFLLALIIGS